LFVLCTDDVRVVFFFFFGALVLWPGNWHIEIFTIIAIQYHSAVLLNYSQEFQQRFESRITISWTEEAASDD